MGAGSRGAGSGVEEVSSIDGELKGVAGDKVECEGGQKATNKLQNWLTLSQWHSSTTGMGGFTDNFAHFHGSGTAVVMGLAVVVGLAVDGRSHS
jgi:hypothetical protein